MYEKLMTELHQAKLNNSLSYSQIAEKLGGKERTTAIRLMQSKNISLRNYLKLAHIHNIKVITKIKKP